jgi:molybdenum cofactor cytidylyltransferase
MRLRPDPARPEVVALVGGGGKSSALFRLAAELRAEGARVVVTTTTRIAVDQIARAPAFVPVTAGDLPLSDVATALDVHGQVLLIGRETIEQGAIRKKAGIDLRTIDVLVAHAGSLGIGVILVEADGSKMLPAKAPAAHEPALPPSTTLLAPVLGLDAIGRPIDPLHLHRPEHIRRLLGLSATEPHRLTPAGASRLLLHPDGGMKDRPLGARLIYLLNKADTPARRAAGRLMADHLVSHGRSALVTTLGEETDAPVQSRHGPIAGIVLAAGESARMGRPKQLIEIAGEPLIVRTVRRALAGGLQQVVVVMGAYRAQVEAALDAAGLTPAAGVVRVDNPRWADGQAMSVHAGLAGLPAAVEAAIFMPVDQPFAPSLLLRQLVRAWQTGAPMAAPSVVGSLRGAPALFDRSLWPELLALQGDVGGRLLLRRYGAEVAGIPVPGELLRDWDRPEDVG